MGPCRRSYILFVQKFRTSEMLVKWSPISKLPDIKLSQIPDSRYIFFTSTRTHLFVIPIEPVSWYLQILSRVYYDWISSIGWHVKFADLYVSLWLSTFCIIFPSFLQAGVSPFDRRNFQLLCSCVLGWSKIYKDHLWNKDIANIKARWPAGKKQKTRVSRYLKR